MALQNDLLVDAGELEVDAARVPDTLVQSDAHGLLERWGRGAGAAVRVTTGSAGAGAGDVAAFR
jgi:hypothetical protein